MQAGAVRGAGHGRVRPGQDGYARGVQARHRGQQPAHRQRASVAQVKAVAQVPLRERRQERGHPRVGHKRSAAGDLARGLRQRHRRHHEGAALAGQGDEAFVDDPVGRQVGQAVGAGLQRVARLPQRPDVHDRQPPARVRRRDQRLQRRPIDRGDGMPEGAAVVVDDLDEVRALGDARVHHRLGLRRRCDGRDVDVLRAVPVGRRHQRPRREQVRAVEPLAGLLFAPHRRRPDRVRRHVHHGGHAEDQLLAERRPARVRVGVDQARQQRPSPAVDLLRPRRRDDVGADRRDDPVAHQHRGPGEQPLAVEHGRAAHHEHRARRGHRVRRGQEQRQSQRTGKKAAAHGTTIAPTKLMGNEKHHASVNKTDFDIRNDVMRELAWDSRVGDKQIGVQVDHGVVTLGGTVEDWATCRAAVEAAHQVVGVMDVANEIQVQEMTATHVTDTDIARTVRHALEWNTLLPDEDIQSTVAAGVVALEGSVATPIEREEAERTVGRLLGVRRVDNRLRVIPASSPRPLTHFLPQEGDPHAPAEAGTRRANQNDMSTTTVGGAGLEQWQIDGARSGLTFRLRHIVVQQIRGRFQRWGGTLFIDRDQPWLSSVQIWVDLASVTTDDPERDAHVRSSEFLDVARFPRAELKSTNVALRDEKVIVQGVLSLHGIAHDVEVTAAVGGTEIDPQGSARAAFTARAVIDRQSFGLHWNQDLDVGGIVVGDEVEIEAEVEAVRLDHPA
jgi:polyisoprenoid-binding protein YceI/osmotically-inducible protein OsmY